MRSSVENQGSDDNEDANGNDGSKDSSSADERTEPRPKRPKRWTGSRYSQPSSAGNGADGEDNESEVNRETLGASVGLVGSSERLAWGKGGIRSHTRHGSNSGSNGKHARNSRLSKLGDYLRNSEQNNNEVNYAFRWLLTFLVRRNLFLFFLISSNLRNTVCIFTGLTGSIIPTCYFSWISTSCLFLLMKKQFQACSGHIFAAGLPCRLNAYLR